MILLGITISQYLRLVSNVLIVETNGRRTDQTRSTPSNPSVHGATTLGGINSKHFLWSLQRVTPKIDPPMSHKEKLYIYKLRNPTATT